MAISDWTITRECWEAIGPLLRPGMVTLECGSGHSTELFEAAGCRHTALEHDERLSPLLPSVVMAPLVGDPPWYDWRPPEPYDLIFIDGPPGYIGRHGILRVLADCLHERTIIVLDDTHRPSERALAKTIAERYGYELIHHHHARRSFTVAHRKVESRSRRC